MDAAPDQTTAEARGGAVPWQPWPFLLMLWGIPGTVVSVALWLEDVEEGGGIVVSIGLAMLSAVLLAVAAVGVIAQGVRLGVAWSRQDERTS